MEFLCKEEVEVSVECEGGWSGEERLLFGAIAMGSGPGW